MLRYQADLALSYNNLAALENYLDRPEEAEQAYRRAIAIQEQLVRMAPSMLQYRRDLAVSHNNLGRVFTDRRQADEAQAAFTQARAILEDLVQDYPAELSYRSSLGGLFNNQGMALEQLGRPDAAVEAYRQAVEHQRLAFEHAPQVDRFREFLSKHYWNLGRALRAADRPDEAATAAVARKALWPNHPQQLYRAAEELALAAGGEPQPEHADASVATLREAIDAGFDDFDGLKHNPGFESLRQYPAFRKLVDRHRELASRGTPAERPSGS